MEVEDRTVTPWLCSDPDPGTCISVREFLVRDRAADTEGWVACCRSVTVLEGVASINTFSCWNL